MFDGKAILKQAGLRVTPQRLAVISILERATDHPKASEVLQRAHKIDDTLSNSTVYRTLYLLEQAGVITRTVTLGESARFKLVGKNGYEQLVDVETGETLEIASEELQLLRARLLREIGYDVVSHRSIVRARRLSVK
ncbi:Fur family transcriptional regulator [Pseudovibrio exalbescens]|uniref:Fur family transcriptional regulator n=1 Tax=Pseudovibrio exalbescens TaxID=197461 RepID=UPI000C9A7387|nr:Fur family transcriptional regulator [Pseudovibrio exalbescens]